MGKKTGIGGGGGKAKAAANEIVIDISEKERRDNPHLVEVSTTQCTMFKALIETLNSSFRDINIKFTKKGIQIIETNKTTNIVANLELYAEKIGYYYCKEDITIGIKIENLYDVIKSISSKNVLVLCIDSNDLDHLRVQVTSTDKNTIYNYRIGLCEVNKEKLNPPDDKYACIISMQSSYFQKICRDFRNISDNIEFRRGKSGQLIMISNDILDKASLEIVINESKDKEFMTFLQNENPDEIIQGVYSLKDLISFSKCTNLSETVKIHLDNRFPLMVEYNVGNMGIIQLNIKDNEEDDGNGK